MIELRKVVALENPSDLLTKHLTDERISHYSDLIGYTFVKGRSSLTSGLHLVSDDGSRYASVDTVLQANQRRAHSGNGFVPQGLPNRCSSCGRGFRSHNRLHAHLAGGDCEGTAIEDTFYDGRRGRAISRVATLRSRGRTAHVSGEDRARAIRMH